MIILLLFYYKKKCFFLIIEIAIQGFFIKQNILIKIGSDVSNLARKGNISKRKYILNIGIDKIRYSYKDIINKKRIQKTCLNYLYKRTKKSNYIYNYCSNLFIIGHKEINRSQLIFWLHISLFFALCI